MLPLLGLNSDYTFLVVTAVLAPIMTPIILQSSAAGQLHKRKHSVDSALEELAVPSDTSNDDNNTEMVPNSISSECTSLDVHVSQTGEFSRLEDLAATVIQSAFRSFLVCYI
jgi:hypothetical protein